MPGSRVCASGSVFRDGRAVSSLRTPPPFGAGASMPLSGCPMPCAGASMPCVGASMPRAGASMPCAGASMADAGCSLLSAGSSVRGSGSRPILRRDDPGASMGHPAAGMEGPGTFIGHPAVRMGHPGAESGDPILSDPVPGAASGGRAGGECGHVGNGARLPRRLARGEGPVALPLVAVVQTSRARSRGKMTAMLKRMV